MSSPEETVMANGSAGPGLESQSGTQGDVGIDGRSARRDRNVLTVLDAAIALFSEDNLQPHPDDVAAKCGLSPRSVRRYYKDGDALLRAAIDRQIEVALPMYRIHAIGEGRLDGRIKSLVKVRVEGYEVLGSTSRAASALAAQSSIVQERFDFVRDRMRDQVERQFAPELKGRRAKKRRAIVVAIDALLQFEGLAFYRRQFGTEESIELLTIAIDDLLTAPT
jgi:TetR/AcrR family transcriptional regulator of autoinduction and epiphytic fitness